MNAEKVTIQQIEHLARENGLITAASRISVSDRNDCELISALARRASTRDFLISDSDSETLTRLSGSMFFDVQIVLCEVIPHLTAATSEVMTLVQKLVESGGEDMAANQPNAAFRKWCATDTARADEVISRARANDRLALKYLVFALEPKNNFIEALRSAKSSGEEQKAGVLALSRMKLQEVEAEHALEHILALSSESDFETAAGLVNAALEIAGDHPTLSRSQIENELARLSSSSDPYIVHLMASALYWHGSKMNDEEVASCLRGILAIDPSNGGTVHQIDQALGKLWNDHPIETSRTLAELTSKTRGGVGLVALDRILSNDKPDAKSQLARMATDWLLGGDHYVCSKLASYTSEINRQTPCFEVTAEMLPQSSAEQAFLCRKAIGYFFVAPMTAAVWLVAVLRGGHPDAACEVEDYLFDPLLLNYGGALKDWLSGLVKEDAPGNEAIRASLRRAREVWDGFDAAKEVVEFEPPSSHRALVHFHRTEEAARAHEAAREKSIFTQLATTQTLIYGDRSCFIITDGDGKHRAQTVDMTRMSVSTEIPSGIYFDPVGTEWLLKTFRHERSSEK